MKYLCEIRDAILRMHDDVSLLVDAIDGDRLSEVKKRYRQIIDRRNDETWDFEDSIITHVKVAMSEILYLEQNEGGEQE